MGNDGYSVVITNNTFTPEAKTYAKRLGVDLIGKNELEEIADTIMGKETPNLYHTGLSGFLIGYILKNYDYCVRSIEQITMFSSKQSLALLELLIFRHVDINKYNFIKY